jgi:hypothetical protein
VGPNNPVRTGTGVLKMFGNFNGGFNVSGAFQDFPISVGQVASSSVYGFSWSADPMSGGNWALLKLIYRDAANNDLVASESIFLNASSTVNDWQLLSASLGPAPLGTDHGSIFLLFLQPEFAGGAAFFDDVAVTVGSGRKVSGTVDFQDTMKAPTSAQVEFRNASGNVVATANAALDASGNYTVLAPAPDGAYDMVVRGTHWLAQKRSVNTTSADETGANFSLINGDADGDNEVSILDYIMLSTGYGTTSADPTFPYGADLDDDAEITILDYITLSTNYGKAGD